MRAPVLVAAAFFALVGPRLSGPRDRAAGAPFRYTPPDGFVEAPGEASGPGLKATWVLRQDGPYTPNISLTHTEKTGGVEEADLLPLVRGMPGIFAESGGVWSELRHETRTRGDGARVGLIEGRTERTALHGRVIQLIFPDDKGTSIVTASFPAEDAARWEARIEATIATATGVACRVPPPPAWLHAVWGVAGAVLAYLALSLRRARRAPQAAPADVRG